MIDFDEKWVYLIKTMDKHQDFAIKIEPLKLVVMWDADNEEYKISCTPLFDGERMKAKTVEEAKKEAEVILRQKAQVFVLKVHKLAHRLNHDQSA